MTIKSVLLALALIALILPGQMVMGAVTAYWSFDADYTSAVNSGTMNGSAVGNVGITGVAGEFAAGIGGLKIDDNATGTQHCVEVNAEIADWDTDPVIAVMGWYKWSNIDGGVIDGWRYLWETDPEFPVSNSIYSTDLQRWAYDTTGGTFNDLTGPLINENEWHHMLTVYNGPLNTVKYYHDGVLRDYRTIPSTMQTFDDRGTKFYIGSSRREAGDRNFDGYMDEVAVFSHEPSAEVVDSIVSGTATPGTAAADVAPDRGFNLVETDRWALVDILPTDDPAGVALAADGTLYATRRAKDAANGGDGGVYRVNTDDTTTLMADDSMTADLTVDNDGDIFFVSDYAGIIRRMDAGTGTVSDWVTDPDGDGLDDDPIGLLIVPDTFDGGAGSLVGAGDGLVVDRDHDIYIWSPDSAETYSLLNDGTEMSDPVDITVSDSEIYAVDNGADKIYKMDLTTGSLAEVTTSEVLDNPISIVVDPKTNDLIVMCDSDVEPTKIVRIDSVTGDVTTIVDTLLDGYGDVDDGSTFSTWMNRSKLVMSADGNYLYIAEQDGDAIYKLQAVPEPSTMAVVMAGLLATIILRRRR
ncbi:MAG: PEP-CTERM sorting domain-containing protein [Pirellulales bacterium]|nr:PEP-CTERM sorting domain-containing protein [Pirellulales bacterium]